MSSMRPERAYSPTARAGHTPDASRVLVIGCGALARELVAVIDQAGLANVDLTCLPATLHNRPGGIPAAVRAKIRAARPAYERIFIAYADCGTGGLLDLALADEGVERLPGAHCYEFYSGSEAFAAMSEDDPATFYLTDFLARNFDRLVIRGLGLDRHPELLPAYFGNYHRLVYLAQTDDPALITAARRAARRLGLTFELRRTGYGDLATGLVAAAAAGTAAAATAVTAGTAATTGSSATTRSSATTGRSATTGAVPAAPAGSVPAAPAGSAPAAVAVTVASNATSQGRDDDDVASGATTTAPAGWTAAGAGDLLPHQQNPAPRGLAGLADEAAERHSRRRASVSRRLLLLEQRRGGSLRERQHPRATVGTASALTPARGTAQPRSTAPPRGAAPTPTPTQGPTRAGGTNAPRSTTPTRGATPTPEAS